MLATDNERPKTSAAPGAQPHQIAMPAPSAVAAAICTMAPGTAMRFHRQEIVEREVQAHTEHEQHHADFGELPGQFDVRDEPRGAGADRNAREQVAHERWHPQAGSDVAQDHGETETRGDGGDEADGVGIGQDSLMCGGAGAVRHALVVRVRTMHGGHPLRGDGLSPTAQTCTSRKPQGLVSLAFTGHHQPPLRRAARKPLP